MTKKTKATPKEYHYEGITSTLAHSIFFWFHGDKRMSAAMKKRLKVTAQLRARECIMDGYVEGELNYEDEWYNYRGWWKIQR